MLHAIIIAAKGPTTKRLAAFMALLWLPIAIVLSLMVGTVWHLAYGLRDYGKDLWEVVTHDIPLITRAFIFALLTGKDSPDYGLNY